jgi:hypothetical protein
VPDQYGLARQDIYEMESCVAATDILDSRKVTEDIYEFLVGFGAENGSRIDDSICCGNFRPRPGWIGSSIQ